MLPTAINHMTVPGATWNELIDMAARLGCVGVEFRNDLPGPLFGGEHPTIVGASARDRAIRILALAEVKAFNDWSDDKRSAAANLMRIAAACGAEAVSLIPRNDGKGTGNGERQANLRVALRELTPLLEEYGLTGLVEPLGFEMCSLRSKAEAVEAIEGTGGARRFRLVHDTFHHFLAGGGPLFPDHTGIVHISGVADPKLGVLDLADGHRVLVDTHDRLGNVEQIGALREAGYDGPISYECFASEVHDLPRPEEAIGGSFEFIQSCLAEPVSG